MILSPLTSIVFRAAGNHQELLALLPALPAPDGPKLLSFCRMAMGVVVLLLVMIELLYQPAHFWNLSKMIYILKYISMYVIYIYIFIYIHIYVYIYDMYIYIWYIYIYLFIYICIYKNCGFLVRCSTKTESNGKDPHGPWGFHWVDPLESQHPRNRLSAWAKKHAGTIEPDWVPSGLLICLIIYINMIYNEYTIVYLNVPSGYLTVCHGKSPF